MNIKMPEIDAPKIINIILGIIVVILCFSIFTKRCNVPKNEFVKGINDTTFNYTQKYTKDSSTHYLEVEAKLTNSKKEIQILEDSLQKVTTENSNIKAQSIISWAQKQIYSGVRGTIDSSNGVIDSLKLELLRGHSKADSLIYENISRNTISVPKTFSVFDKWLEEKGTIYKDYVSIDSLIVYSEPSVIFGEKHKRFLGMNVGRPTVVATILDKNPHTFQSNPKAYLYQQKSSKIGLTIGPSINYNGKIQFGVGATLGWRVF